MKKNRKLSIVAILLAAIMLIVPFFSLNVLAQEDSSSTAETTESTAPVVKGVKISSLRAYGTNDKYYPDSINSIKNQKSIYTAKVTIPRWMTNCLLYISADKSAKVTYDGKAFEYTKSSPYDGKAYFYYNFEFDKAEKKDATHEYEITLTQGDEKSTLVFTVRQTVIKAKLESISVAGEKAKGSATEGFTYTLPAGTESAKIKIVPRSEEKLNFAKQGEELKEVELNKNYQNYQFKQSLEEGENVFDIQVVADSTKIDSTLTIYVGEPPVSSVPEAVVTPTDTTAEAILINGKDKTPFGLDMRGDNLVSYVNLVKGANEMSILYNSTLEKSIVLTLVPNGSYGGSEPIVDVSGKPVELTLTDNGYEGTVPLSVGANNVTLKANSGDAAQMAIYLGKGLNFVDEPVVSDDDPAAPVESSEPEKDKSSDGLSPLVWVIIGIIGFVILGVIIYAAIAAGNKNRDRYDYDSREDYYRGPRPQQRPGRDIGSYIDDDYGYDNDQSYRDDGYYDQEPPYYDDNAPRGGDRYYEDDDGFYDERPSRRRPAGGQPVRRDSRYRPSQRNNYDDYYDDNDEY